VKYKLRSTKYEGGAEGDEVQITKYEGGAERDDAGCYATEDIAACDVPGKRGGPRISGRTHGFAF
jgi:hypothetical protein